MTLLDLRIIEAVRRAIGRGYEPRHLYLDPRDRQAFVKSHGSEKKHVDGMEIRSAERSRLVCRGWAVVDVPKDPRRPEPPRRIMSNQKRLMHAAMARA
jgi:hypothetical protein